MLAIYKRELRSYFVSAVGYVFVAVLVALSAAIFSMTTLLSATNDISTYFTLMLFVLMVTLPMLTMKLFAEERKMKTEQLLLTSPVSIGKMVMAKFFAAYTVFFGANLLCSLAYISLFVFSDPEGGVILGNIIAVSLVGAAFIAMGMFVSALTENQLAAAIGTFFMILVMLLIGLLGTVIHGILHAMCSAGFQSSADSTCSQRDFLTSRRSFITFPFALYFCLLPAACMSVADTARKGGSIR